MENLLDKIVGLPTGTPLFSHIFGNVVLDDIVDSDIIVKLPNGRLEIFNKYGQYYYDNLTDDVSPCCLLELN